MWPVVPSADVALDALIAGGPLRVDFQPIVDLSRGAVHGFEVLGRCGPLGGPLAGLESPLALLDFAETRGRLLALDRRWRTLAIEVVASYTGDERFFLNVDPRAAVDPGHAPGFTRELVRRAGLSPSRFVLELTEQTGDRETAERLLHQYRAEGFGVAVDDFGAPLQSIATVLRLRPDALKLDAEITRGAPDDPLRRQLLRSLAQLAQDAGIVLVAEGIETEAELAAVCAAGVRFGQGYFLGRPSPRPTVLDPRLAALVRATFAHEAGRCARERPDTWDSLLRLLEAVARERSLEGLLQQVTGFSAALLGVERSNLRLLDESRRRLLVAARTGPAVHRGAGADFVVGEGLVGWVVANRSSLRVGRAETDARFRPKPGAVGRVGSFLGVPLLDDDGCIGVLAASSPDADAFTAEDERRLRVVAEIVAPRLEAVRLRRLAQTDPLTGLWNRRGLDHLVPERLREGEVFSLAAIDIDRFKTINDRFGHAVGDDVLRAVAVALSSAVRQGDAVVRVGGEELVLVLRGASLELALPIAERARAAIEALTVLEDGDITVSIGVAEQRPGEARDEVLARADAALYRAKELGRNRVERDG